VWKKGQEVSIVKNLAAFINYTFVNSLKNNKILGNTLLCDFQKVSNPVLDLTFYCKIRNEIQPDPQHWFMLLVLLDTSDNSTSCPSNDYLGL
jgi:hypothetical protein